MSLTELPDRWIIVNHIPGPHSYSEKVLVEWLHGLPHIGSVDFATDEGRFEMIFGTSVLFTHRDTVEIRDALLSGIPLRSDGDDYRAANFIRAPPSGSPGQGINTSTPRARAVCYQNVKRARTSSSEANGESHSYASRPIPQGANHRAGPRRADHLMSYSEADAILRLSGGYVNRAPAIDPIIQAYFNDLPQYPPRLATIPEASSYDGYDTETTSVSSGLSMLSSTDVDDDDLAAQINPYPCFPTAQPRYQEPIQPHPCYVPPANQSGLCLDRNGSGGGTASQMSDTQTNQSGWPDAYRNPYTGGAASQMNHTKTAQSAWPSVYRNDHTRGSTSQKSHTKTDQSRWPIAYRNDYTGPVNTGSAPAGPMEGEPTIPTPIILLNGVRLKDDEKDEWDGLYD
ncbi:hypothetical protein Q8F55_007320 [Vanrija albida]|uniref:Uncharacterized protein n=1 Tax=Vanrija albida TaxID=181172 RepID=A0ABR3PZJ6_9TREE